MRSRSVVLSGRSSTRPASVRRRARSSLSPRRSSQSFPPTSTRSRANKGSKLRSGRRSAEAVRRAKLHRAKQRRPKRFSRGTGARTCSLRSRSRSFHTRCVTQIPMFLLECHAPWDDATLPDTTSSHIYSPPCACADVLCARFPRRRSPRAASEDRHPDDGLSDCGESGDSVRGSQGRVSDPVPAHRGADSTRL